MRKVSIEEIEACERLERELYEIVELARLQREMQDRSNRVEPIAFCESQTKGEEDALCTLSSMAHGAVQNRIRALTARYHPCPQDPECPSTT